MPRCPPGPSSGLRPTRLRPPPPDTGWDRGGGQVGLRFRVQGCPHRSSVSRPTWASPGDPTPGPGLTTHHRRTPYQRHPSDLSLPPLGNPCGPSLALHPSPVSPRRLNSYLLRPRPGPTFHERRRNLVLVGHTWVRVVACMSGYVCTRVYVYMCGCWVRVGVGYVCVTRHTCTCVRVDTCVCMCVHVCLYVRVDSCVCMYV